MSHDSRKIIKVKHWLDISKMSNHLVLVDSVDNQKLFLGLFVCGKRLNVWET